MRRLLVICGPTASGKTELGLCLAQRYPLRLISVDSQQVYVGMDIGTAKPAPDQRKNFALIDVAQPGEGYSAGDFCRMAVPLVEEAWATGRCACLVGGTGLYMKALLEGLAEVPPVPARIRHTLESELSRVGLPALAAELVHADPALADRSDLRNPRRVLRGLEVARATGKPLSAWQAEAPGPWLLPDKVLWLGLLPSDAELRQRIQLRAQASLAGGWLDEARALRLRHGDGALLASGAIGYGEVLQVLDGNLSLEKAEKAITQRTWAYARRQKTWFRKAPVAQWLSQPNHAPELQAFFE